MSASHLGNGDVIKVESVRMVGDSLDWVITYVGTVPFWICVAMQISPLSLSCVCRAIILGIRKCRPRCAKCNDTTVKAWIVAFMTLVCIAI